MKTLSLLLLFLVGVLPGASTANASASGTVVAWGATSSGQTAVPVEAQNGVTAIAAGASHTVALKSDGSVVAWGDSNLGQTTVPSAAQSGVTAIAAGGLHTVALKTDGSVLAWGYNGQGQTTVPAAAQSGVTAIAAAGSFGGGHTVALKTGGSVIAWGDNSSGQTTVPVAAQSGVKAIAAGNYRTVALKTDGSVVAWGDDTWGQTTVPVAAQSGVTAIAAGTYHTVALKTDGSVVAWGDNSYGQTTVPVAAQSGVVAIASGAYHTVALVSVTVAGPMNDAFSARLSITATSATVTGSNVGATKEPGEPNHAGEPGGKSVWWTWTAGASGTAIIDTVGSSFDTILGVYTGTTVGTLTLIASDDQSGGNNTSRVTVNVVTGTTYQIAVDGYAGAAGTITLTINATSSTGGSAPVVAWGAGKTSTVSSYEYGQSIIPAGLAAVAAISAGDSHTVVLKSDGTVVAWGYNFAGQTTVPASLSGVTAISAGNSHTVALKSDGTVVAWGSNNGGTGLYAGQATVPAGLTGVMAIAAGAFHTVALKNNGTVVAWGYNANGQASVPAGLSGVTSIAAGGSHTVALKSDGTVVAWGYNGFGETTVPTDLSGVIAIAAGGYHTVALKNNGTVVAWGINGYGQTTVPAGLSGVIAIAAGGSHTVALKNDGTVVAWGAGNTTAVVFPKYGQSIVPAGLSGVTAIAAGGYHTVALVGIPPVNYTITVSAAPGAGGTVGGGGTFAAGSRTVTATASTGYTFANWTEGGSVVSTSASYSFTLSGNRTLVANFTVSQTTYTISLSASPNGAGAVSGAGSFLVGSSQTVTAAPTGGYNFANWTENGSVVSSSASYNFALTGNRTLVANFTGLSYTYTLTTLASPAEGGTISGGGSFPSGTVVNVAIQSASGWYVKSLVNTNFSQLDSWQRLAILSALSGNDYTTTAGPVTVDGNKTIAVTFAPSAPTITTPALSQVVDVGQSVTLAAAATGMRTLSYQWSKDGTALSGAGATTASYVIPAAQPSDAGIYTLVVNNSAGITSSTASLTVNPVPNQPPTITTQPGGASFTLGQDLTLSVIAVGSEPLSYLWQFNGTYIPGATGSMLRLTNLAATNAGAYRVVVTHVTGSVTSDAADVYYFGDLHLLASTVLAGPIGQQFRVDYADSITGGTTNWQVLTNITLPSSPYLVIDPSSAGKPQRFYRAVPVP